MAYLQERLGAMTEAMNLHLDILNNKKEKL
jgi:hypothetical protein